jgi:hypothetical protein
MEMFFPLFFLLQPTFVTSTTCTGSTYSYDGSDCSPCPLGATFISSSLGCAPSSFPLDTKFYLSGTQTEGVSAFSTSTIVTYSTDVFGTVNGAMNLASGGVISLMGSSLSSAMPQQTDDFTLSTWIKADPQTSSVIGLGDLGEVDRGLLSTKTAGIFVSPSGTMTEETLAYVDTFSGFGNTKALAVGPSGNVYAMNPGFGKISKFVPGITPNHDFITGLQAPTGLDVDVNDNIWVVDATNPTTIKKYNSGGTRSFSVTSGCTGQTGHIAVDSNGDFAYYVCRATNSHVKKISSDGSTISNFASLTSANGIAVDKLNNVFVTIGTTPGKMMKILPDGTISTLVSFGLYYPVGIFVDKFGNIMVADQGNKFVKKVSPSGVLTNLIIVDEYYPSDIAQSPNGDFFVSFDNSFVMRFRPKLYLPVCDSTWHHVAITRSSQKTQLAAYIDGKLISQHAISPTLPLQSSSLLIIGNDFSGTVSDLRIYNRILGPSELEALSLPSAASFPGQNLALYSSSPNGYTFQFSCKLGYSGPLAVLSKSNLDNSYSWTTTPNCIQCEAGTFSSSQSGITICHLCPPGTYSLVGASSCTPCPAGTYGNRAGLTTNACSGLCPSCLSGTAYPPASSSSSSLSCSSGGARALPSDLNMRLWPAAHQSNLDAVDRIIAPEATCKTVLGVSTCVGRTSLIVDNTIHYVLGTAAELNMEAGEDLVCATTTT